MPKVVKTPDGPRLVLTQDEYDKMRDQNRARKYPSTRMGDLLCPFCRQPLNSVSVDHTTLLDEKDPYVLGWQEAWLLDEVQSDPIVYCTQCDPLPEFVGLPVAVADSFHNQPN